ncbi:deoxyribodipyrimidine photo-lyase [Vibrio sp. SCSIO 43136]|uniref:deoxyribodipyrimidine photo-lyase n=1 Tax=Vibrio sp. SCSIO 43136 TaxID=2819101 RepID=UPI0020751388|nr:deoxyribodipyrimidine photo-lyase [Vibrio sp. SCSIO 43136]USD67916.1 deoxyribodipyrimidine photo-lyase [Vibrio sp. SCSIO 43136]
MQLIWFRRDLRTIDNPALLQAIKSGQPVVAVYTATPLTWQSHNVAPIQTDLTYRRLHCLKQSLAELGIPLLCSSLPTYADSAEAVATLAETVGVSAIHSNLEYPIDESRRDALLDSKLAASDIEIFWYHDRCAMVPGSVMNQQGAYFKVFTPFKKAWIKQFLWHECSVTAPEAVRQQAKLPQLPQGWTENIPESDGSSDAYPVDDQALSSRLNQFVELSAPDYKLRRDFPSQAATSQLSPYLAIGAISVKQCLVSLLNVRNIDELGEGEHTWLSELIWREFYQHLLVFEPRLAKGEAFVKWSENIIWHSRNDWLLAWQQGATGYPIVDAAMRQLNQTGWMHNRLRMIVASFLTKDLLINWREGERYFMSQLIDGDFAANNGGWQWSASTGCDGQPYFRIFNPITQGEKFDPNGEFVRRWLPELSGVPDKFIHKPWLWQGCQDLAYPSPIVDHSIQRGLALEMYQQAKEMGNE